MTVPSPAAADTVPTFTLSFEPLPGITWTSTSTVSGNSSNGDGSTVSAQPMFQCAEAKVFACDFYGSPAVCKHRFPKAYRHPSLDKKLREQRTVREARALARCHKAGIRVPAVYGVDKRACRLFLERVPGTTVKDALDQLEAALPAVRTSSGSDGNWVMMPAPPPPAVARLLRGIGEVVGQLHSAGVIHGDLTTSNFMVMPSIPLRVSETAPAETPDRDGLVAIDFGLVSDKSSPEERAVDLYVLERALASTHPFAESYAAATVLEGYRRTVDPKRGEATLARLEVVRARGRKRSMIG